MILRKIPFVNKKHYSPGGLPVVGAEGSQRICSKIQNCRASDNPCSSSSEEDEFSDPLEVATSTGARLSTPERASISRKRIRFLWFVLRETQSYDIDESVWYDYVYDIYVKWNRGY